MNYKLIKLSRVLLRIMGILTILLILVFTFANSLDIWIIHKFMSIYMISFLLFIFYVFIASILQIKNLNKTESRKRIISFFKYFIFNFLSLFVLSIIFNKSDILNILVISFSGSFGFNFLDLIFFKYPNKFKDY
ncbi:hypothetical protein ANS017_03440 [Paraclostridium bifermentans]|nr:hypothetical protein ANS014_20330 [Paraclostridium bifermentans]GKZ07137.1 hypothetical protein ANS015_20200 [Paraclostridium bifermentans]GKZ08960.1 hypothetical protein ANS017_03440 [Paraclostridium bifermentans]